jgi:hypothetical protein
LLPERPRSILYPKMIRDWRSSWTVGRSLGSIFNILLKMAPMEGSCLVQLLEEQNTQNGSNRFEKQWQKSIVILYLNLIQKFFVLKKFYHHWLFECFSGGHFIEDTSQWPNICFLIVTLLFMSKSKKLSRKSFSFSKTGIHNDSNACRIPIKQ